MCAALLTFVCMMRYSEWNFVPIWFLYSSVLMAIRYADLQSGSGILRYLWWYAVPIWFLYSGFFDVSLMFASVPCSVFFLSVGSVSQRKVASGRAAAEEG